MKKLQDLLGEANQLLESAAQVKLQVPITQTGTLYEVTDSTLGLTHTVGLVKSIADDYEQGVGIGSAVPRGVAGLPSLLNDIREAAAGIVRIAETHAKVMDGVTWLCFNHVTHKFPGQPLRYKGGIPRIQIEDSASVFQVDFPIQHGPLVTSHRVDLLDITEGDAFMRDPFSQIPPNITIPDSYQSSNQVPATFDAWSSLLASTPHNVVNHTMFRSRTADILNDFRSMVEELIAA